MWRKIIKNAAQCANTVLTFYLNIKNKILYNFNKINNYKKNKNKYFFKKMIKINNINKYIKLQFKKYTYNINFQYFKKHKKLQESETQQNNFQNQIKKGNFQKLNIISWNVNGIRPRFTKGEICDIINKYKPDIITLQEHKLNEDSLQKLKLEEKYEFTKNYKQYWNFCNSQKGYSGVCVFSKQKPITVIKGFPDQTNFDDEGRLLTLEYNNFYLCSAYVPNLTKVINRKYYRYEWNSLLSKFLNKLKTHKNVILAGDLNVAHEDLDPFDSYINRSKSGFTYREIHDFDEFMNTGWNDTYRLFYPTQAGITTKKAVGKQYRFDYFIVNNNFSNNINSSKILNENKYTSDHFPIKLNLSVSKQQDFKNNNYENFFQQNLSSQVNNNNNDQNNEYQQQQQQILNQL